jgi:3D (Asp-Asp-Asp) domain-containing protein
MKSACLSVFAAGATMFALATIWMPYPPPILPHVHDYRSMSLTEPHLEEPMVPFIVTAYCTCPICTGQWSDGRTATGTWATEGRTVAADPTVFGMGTCVSVPGIGIRTVEDTGSAIKWRAIDVFIDSHERARRFGVRFLNVKQCA